MLGPERSAIDAIGFRLNVVGQAPMEALNVIGLQPVFRIEFPITICWEYFGPNQLRPCQAGCHFVRQRGRYVAWIVIQTGQNKSVPAFDPQRMEGAGGALDIASFAAEADGFDQGAVAPEGPAVIAALQQPCVALTRPGQGPAAMRAGVQEGREAAIPFPPYQDRTTQNVQGEVITGFGQGAVMGKHDPLRAEESHLPQMVAPVRQVVGSGLGSRDGHGNVLQGPGPNSVLRGKPLNSRSLSVYCL